MSISLGTPPKEFTFEFYDKDKKYGKIGPISPINFYTQHVKPRFNVDDKVSWNRYQRNQFFQPVLKLAQQVHMNYLEASINWSTGSSPQNQIATLRTLIKVVSVITPNWQREKKGEMILHYSAGASKTCKVMYHSWKEPCVMCHMTL